MSGSSRARTTPWRDTAAARVIGAAASWMLMGFALALLFRSAFDLMLIGGSCASGGPYEIRVECPGAVALFTPLSILLGFIAVGISALLARGFGMPIILAWTALFCGLGVIFLIGFAASPGAVAWLVVGILFIVMGSGPLVLALRANPRELVSGSVSVHGRPFVVEPPGRSWIPRRALAHVDAVRPTRADILLSMGVTLGAVVVGVGLAIVLYGAVAG